MEKLTIIVSENPSKDFPIKVEWTINHIDYSTVFEDGNSIIYYFMDRYNAKTLSILDIRKKPKAKRQPIFKRGVNIPKSVRSKTSYNMRKWNLCSYDAFVAAVRETPASEMPKELVEDWYFSRLSKYLA